MGECGSLKSGFSVYVFVHEQSMNSLFLLICLFMNYIIKAVYSQENAMVANSSWTFLNFYEQIYFKLWVSKIQNFHLFVFHTSPCYIETQCHSKSTLKNLSYIGDNLDVDFPKMGCFVVSLQKLVTSGVMQHPLFYWFILSQNIFAWYHLSRNGPYYLQQAILGNGLWNCQSKSP